MPTERAHGIQVMHMCSAFSHEGAEVTLLVPDRKTIEEDPFDYYGIEPNFKIEKVPVPDTVRFGKLGFLIESILFARKAIKRVPSDAIIYTREELALLFAPPSSHAYYEAHNLRKGLFFRNLIKQATGIITISKGIRDAITGLPFPERKILIAHDGYDKKQFNVSISKEESRKALGLPVGAPIAMYIGGFEDWKGSETLFKASNELYKEGIRVAAIGGSEQQLVVLRKGYPNIFFLGTRPYREIASNQKSADVLVIPNSASERISREFTSPLKLFASMASGRTIVASDLPSIREVLTKNEAIFFKPDDVADLARAIKEAIHPVKLILAEKALQKVEEYTWDKRAKNILAFLSRISA